MNLRTIREYLRGSFWFAPAAGVLVAGVLVYLTLAADRAIPERDLVIAFSGGPDSARTILSTIAGAMITFIALVFTITIVVLQLASQQFSPRVLRTFLRDRQTKISLAIFVATFMFALLVLREVRAGQDAPGAMFVPRLSISATFALVTLSIGAFVAYVHHIAQAVRAATILDLVAEETRELIDKIHPAGDEELDRASPALGQPVAEITAAEPGIVTDFDPETLVALAVSADCVLELAPSIGDFVPTGSVLFRVHGEAAGLDHEHVRGEIHLSSERTMQQDIGFGLRQLVDVAIRALSPAVNDPTTAVRALDHIHDLLRRLGTRPLRPGQHRHQDGTVRLLYPVPSWSGYVELGLEEIRQNGARHVQVTRRLRAILEDLRTAVPEERRADVLRQEKALDRAVDGAFELEHERSLAAEKDPKGLGS